MLDHALRHNTTLPRPPTTTTTTTHSQKLLLLRTTVQRDRSCTFGVYQHCAAKSYPFLSPHPTAIIIHMILSFPNIVLSANYKQRSFFPCSKRKCVWVCKCMYGEAANAFSVENGVGGLYFLPHFSVSNTTCSSSLSLSLSLSFCSRV